ncbi:DNA polymerase III subunit alpha [bacterium]|nr:DNA polymerase III subunit alpha [bacterium]
MTGFAELAAATNFSFLRGASHPEEMVQEAKALGLAGLGVADRNTLAGVVRAHAAAKAAGLALAVGARLSFMDETPDVLVYPRDRAGYGRLCRLLTLGARRAPKGACHLTFEDLLDHGAGLQPIVTTEDPGGADAERISALRARLAQARGVGETSGDSRGEVWLAAPFRIDGEDRRRLRRLKGLAAATGARLIATTEPLHHAAERRALLDVLTCIREKVRLDEAGRLLAANAERRLKPPDEMARLCRDAPEAVAESLRFLAGSAFSLDQLSYQYPDEIAPGFDSAQAALEALTLEGARKRYPGGIPPAVRATLERELGIVAQLNYAPYFLTVADIVRFAREDRGILCQGRGSAANSTICFCLGVTSVDPAVSSLLFDRFISTERNEPPDIDVDFEHERREEAIQYVYAKYGRSRAALAATLIRYRTRSAIRDVCKVFGFSEDVITALSRTQQWWSRGIKPADLAGAGLDPSDGRLMRCIALAGELQGFPRHLSQHVGGLVITRDRLDEVAAIQNAAMADRTVVEWDKDDLQELKILKVDLLGLGMLTCLRKAFSLIDRFYPDWSGGADPAPLTLDTLPKEDPRVYAMLGRADSVGVFQVESRAQMTMLPRLKPRCFYDLVIEVAIVRPGPIQGGMVHPYLRRRQGLEQVTYPSEALKQVLERTLGVPLFQEQAMQIAIVAAGFSPPEADKLRRAMATFRRVGTIGQLKEKFIRGMIGNGYDPAFAEASFRQIEGFGEYGFPESHAASFALLVYASCWLKCHYPDVFAAALLNAQPMGFYAPAQIVRDAQEHGVEIRPIDINASDWDNTLEPGEPARTRLHPRHRDMADDIRSRMAMRLGFRQAGGLSEADIRRLVERRGAGYRSLRDVWVRGGASKATIERLADADVFGSIGLDRRAALWAARALGREGDEDDLPLFTHAPAPPRPPDLTPPEMTLGEKVVEDFRTLRLSLKAHPVGLLRDTLAARWKAATCETLATARNGARVRVAGLILVRQRPGTASGVIFMTLEDETHIANIVVWPKVFERYRREVLGARLCLVEGVVQSESGVVHVIARRIEDLTPALAELTDGPAGEELTPPHARADEVRRPVEADARTHPRNVRHDLSAGGAESVMPRGRNFH